MIKVHILIAAGRMKSTSRSWGVLVIVINHVFSLILISSIFEKTITYYFFGQYIRLHCGWKKCNSSECFWLQRCAENENSCRGCTFLPTKHRSYKHHRMLFVFPSYAFLTLSHPVNHLRAVLSSSPWRTVNFTLIRNCTWMWGKPQGHWEILSNTNRTTTTQSFKDLVNNSSWIIVWWWTSSLFCVFVGIWGLIYLQTLFAWSTALKTLANRKTI